MEKWILIKLYMLERLGEASTWQGIATVVAMFGCKIGYGMDWGPLAAIGAMVSASIKMMFPDTKASPPPAPPTATPTDPAMEAKND